MQQKKPFPPDEICNPNWDSLLKDFHAIDSSSKDAKEKFNQLKELSKTKIMTERQHEGIIDRCDYQIYLIDNPGEAKKLAEQTINNMKYGKVESK